MALCIKCAVVVDEEDSKTVCLDCVKKLLAQMDLTDFVDIQRNMEKYMARYEGRWKVAKA